MLHISLPATLCFRKAVEIKLQAVACSSSTKSYCIELMNLVSFRIKPLLLTLTVSSFLSVSISLFPTNCCSQSCTYFLSNLETRIAHKLSIGCYAVVWCVCGNLDQSHAPIMLWQQNSDSPITCSLSLCQK